MDKIKEKNLMIDTLIKRIEELEANCAAKDEIIELFKKSNDRKAAVITARNQKIEQLEDKIIVLRRLVKEGN